MKTTNPLPNAKDLTQEAPRSPRERIGGYALIARMIDKGRATLNGTNGDYHFNCPLDNMLFGFKEVNGDDVRQVLQSGASDQEVARWITENGAKKTPEEIKAWSDSVEKFSFYNVPEKKEWFTEECQRLGLKWPGFVGHGLLLFLGYGFSCGMSKRYPPACPPWGAKISPPLVRG